MRSQWEAGSRAAGGTRGTLSWQGAFSDAQCGLWPWLTVTSIAMPAQQVVREQARCRSPVR